MKIDMRLDSGRVFCKDDFDREFQFVGSYKWNDPDQPNHGYQLIKRGNKVMFLSIDDQELIYVEDLVEGQTISVKL